MEPVRETHRSGMPVRKTGLFLTVLLTSVVLVTGCGRDEQAREDAATDQNAPAQTTEQSEQGTSAEQAEDAEMDRDTTVGESARQEVTLKLEGDPGTAFSGACNVGDQGEEITERCLRALSTSYPKARSWTVKYVRAARTQAASRLPLPHQAAI